MSAKFSQPWLLRFFDRIQFSPVSEEELLEAREAMIGGGYHLQAEDGEFVVRDYNALVSAATPEAEDLKRRQRAAAAIATQGY